MNRRSFIQSVIGGVAGLIGLPLALKAEKKRSGTEFVTGELGPLLNSRIKQGKIIKVSGSHYGYDGIYKKSEDGEWIKTESFSPPTLEQTLYKSSPTVLRCTDDVRVLSKKNS